MIKKTFSLTTLLLAIVALSGCTSKKATGPYADLYNRNNDEIVLPLGIARMDPGSYDDKKATTINLNSSELLPAENISGNTTTILWGLITLSDH